MYAAYSVQRINAAHTRLPVFHVWSSSYKHETEHLAVSQLLVVEDLDIGVEGFRAISALPDLRSLTLTSCDGIDRSGLELLCNLSNLQYLDMSDVWEFAGDTLQPLASLTNLQVLPHLTPESAALPSSDNEQHTLHACIVVHACEGLINGVEWVQNRVPVLREKGCLLRSDMQHQVLLRKPHDSAKWCRFWRSQTVRICSPRTFLYFAGCHSSIHWTSPDAPVSMLSAFATSLTSPRYPHSAYRYVS
ncbi:MAG: hypothetical protein HC767_04875 [Akkermansiaceae bacterium]|nr:hypothetical protein [Akkermansiaceae bacterium]